MATYDVLNQPGIPAPKPGSNWWHIHLDFSEQNMQTADVIRFAKVKNHWIIKDGFSRITQVSVGATATADIGTTSGGQELSAALNLDGADTWTRLTVVDDDGPVAIIADDYLYFEMLTVAAYSGIVDLLIEVIMCPTDAE